MMFYMFLLRNFRILNIEEILPILFRMFEFNYSYSIQSKK